MFGGPSLSNSQLQSSGHALSSIIFDTLCEATCTRQDQCQRCAPKRMFASFDVEWLQSSDQSAQCSLAFNCQKENRHKKHETKKACRAAHSS